MKKQNPKLTSSAISVDSAHEKLNNARRNYKRQRELYLKAKVYLQQCEYNLNSEKEICDHQLIETV